MLHSTSMMMMAVTALSLLLGTAQALETPATGTSATSIPSFTMKDLLTNQSSQNEFAMILQTTGLLSITLPTNEDLHRVTALDGLCACTDLLSLEGTDTAVLDDATTVRKTLATATVGTSPMALPLDALAAACGSDTADAMEALRDHVAHASETFVKALDQAIMSHQHPNVHKPMLLGDIHGKPYPNISSVLATANHLEHFHVYSKNKDAAPTANDENNKNDKSLEWHTDAGLFLSFVPAMNCNNKNSDDSFYFKDHHGRTTHAIFEPNSIVFMLGAGAEHWLQSSMPLKATRHAVQMKAGSERAWYGMMHLVPESAIIQTSPDRTFGDMKKNMVMTGKKRREYGHEDTPEVVSIGCGPAINVAEKQSKRLDTAHDLLDITPRRRVQHVDDASACNNATNFFCWVRCLDIPSYDQAPSYDKEGYSLYCLDPGILARSGNVVSEAVEPCGDFVHNSNCMGVWQPTAPGIFAQEVAFDAPEIEDPPFCYGGTSMYMDGFTWIHATTCVIYLFPEWVLTTPGKFAAAAIGTFFFGILLEWVISQRRKVCSKLGAGYHRLATSAAFYGLQLTMGYMLMLVIMIYSGPLFMMTIFGIMAGHVLFNAKDAIFSEAKAKAAAKKKAALGADVTEPTYGSCCEKKEGAKTLEEGCCASSQVEKESCCGSNGEDENDNDGVPEGSTPCCQHTL